VAVAKVTVVRILGWAVAFVAVVVVALSPRFGRAEPTADYRPPVPADALANGCYPLPAGLRFDFPYQVRSDADVATPRPHRRLVLQYDERDAATVRRMLGAELSAAGLPAGAAVVTPLDGVPAGSIVRGTVVLTLPQVADQRPADPTCADPASTKRTAAP